MKIAWFTPFSTKSAIARFSQAVVAELAKVAEVDLCHFEAKSARETAVPVKQFASAAVVDDRFLSSYDLVVYNFGNYLPFHREIFLLSRRFPGVCVLHDFVMHHFFAAFYFEELRNPEAYALSMERLYGGEGRRVARARLAGPGTPVWETDDVVRFPFFEEAIRGAVGVVTHSEFFKRRVEAEFVGPVRRIPLPYEIDRRSSVLSRRDLGVDEDRVLVVTVGHVNPNKRVREVIDVLGRIGSSAERVLYAVLGPSSEDYQHQLDEAVKRNHLENVVRFLGHVSEEVLRAYLSHADICVNLRFPAMEGASASAIEEMLFGKPIIVTDVGFFSELPDECVVKIRPEGEDELKAAFERIIIDSAERTRIGLAAQKFAEAEFRADRYAAELIEFAPEVQAAHPLLSLADRVGSECSRMGIVTEMETVSTVAQHLRDLWCEKRES